MAPNTARAITVEMPRGTTTVRTAEPRVPTTVAIPTMKAAMRTATIGREP